MTSFNKYVELEAWSDPHLVIILEIGPSQNDTLTANSEAVVRVAATTNDPHGKAAGIRIVPPGRGNDRATAAQVEIFCFANAHTLLRLSRITLSHDDFACSESHALFLSSRSLSLFLWYISGWMWSMWETARGSGPFYTRFGAGWMWGRREN